MARSDAEDAIEMAPLNKDLETGSDERREERGAARTDPVTAGTEREEGGGGGAGDGMISTNMNTSDGEEGGEHERIPFIPPVQTESANRPTGRHEEAIEVVEHVLLDVMHDVVGADIGRDGCWDKLRNPLGTISGLILNMLITGAIIFDWASVWKYIHQYWRDPETDLNPLYWCLGLPCLLSPGLLLLALTSYYYITKKAEFTANNLFGVCGLAALFPLFIFASSFNFILRAMLGKLNKTDIRWAKVMMPFTIVEILPQAVLRLISNPYDWSTVVNWTVNISMVSVLLITFGIFELSAEKLSWELWHKWMKKNAEVATNIENQESERRSEEGNRQCCSCMRKFPVIKILVTVVLGLWPAGDIFSDCYSVWDYYDRYRRGLVQAWFWQLGLISMFIPGLFDLMLRIHRFCRERERISWSEWAVVCAVHISIYPLLVIKNSIYTAVRTLRGEVTEGDIERTKEVKLVEIIGESLPQAALSAGFISNNGLAKYNIPNIISCVLSFGNILIGVLFYRTCTTCDIFNIPIVG